MSDRHRRKDRTAAERRRRYRARLRAAAEQLAIGRYLAKSRLQFGPDGEALFLTWAQQVLGFDQATVRQLMDLSAPSLTAESGSRHKPSAPDTIADAATRAP